MADVTAEKTVGEQTRDCGQGPSGQSEAAVGGTTGSPAASYQLYQGVPAAVVPGEQVLAAARERAAALGVRYDERGLVPAIVQQEGTGEVLMMAWMDAESLALTLATRTSWFWSRSRRELWNKGATSGNVQQVKAVRYDCDVDTLLLVVDSPGPACHTGARSCFYREVELG